MRVSWPSTAFVDESESQNLYLLAAVIIQDRAADELRPAVDAMRLAGPKLHWTKESDQRRQQVVAAVVRLAIPALVVLGTREIGERARRKSLRRMLWELDQRGVERVVFEARERRQNARDMELIAHLLRSHELRGPLHTDHVAGRVEPLLWLADVVAGAIRAHREQGVGYPDLVRLVDVVEL